MTIASLSPELQKGAVDPFFTTLNDDLAGSRVFLVADPTLYPKGLRPPHNREEGDPWKATSAQYLLDTRLAPDGATVVVEAQLLDLGTLKPILARSTPASCARRVASPTRSRTTSPASSRESPGRSSRRSPSLRPRRVAGKQVVKEIYTMDFDGESQRRVTYSRTLSLAPDWSPDGKKIVYQSYEKDTPGLWLIGKDGARQASRSPPDAAQRLAVVLARTARRSRSAGA